MSSKPEHARTFRRSLTGRRLLLFCLGLILIARPASALTDEEIFRNFKFNLINPGARSLALGGAFISLADDATAAQANPAGLGFLRTSEYFIEMRLVDNAAQSASVEEDIPPNIATDVTTGSNLDDTVSPTFFAGVWNLGDKWKVAMSRSELVNLKNSTLSTFSFSFTNPPGAFLTEGTGSIDVEITNYNYSFGYKVTDHVGIGGTLTLSGFEVQSEVVNEVIDTGRVLSEMLILEETLDLRTTIDDSDKDVVFSLGFIYKVPNKWSVGAVYRQGPDFTVTERIDAEGLDSFGVRDRLGSQFENRFHLPDVFGIGGNWHPNDKLTLALNVERITYSNLLDGYVPGVNILTSEDAEFTADDATDVRVGMEYFFINWKRPLALRFGAFMESDATIRATFTGSNSFSSEEVFGGQDDELHGALGVGFNLGKSYKIDAAADFSESANEYVISLIYQGK